MTQKFYNWIYERGGPQKVGASVGLTRQAVYRWIWNEKYPSRETAAKLISLSGGQLRLTDMLRKKSHN
jgi:hypothetical protein